MDEQGYIVTPATTVLAVDDNDQALRIMERMLTRGGFDVISARDGEEAWRFLQGHNGGIAAIITDRNMPGIDGVELLRRVKSHACYQNVPVIFQTGMADSQDVVDGMEAGVYYYLTKPYNKKMFLAVVRAATEGYHRYKALRDELEGNISTLRHMTEGRFRLKTLEEAHDLACTLASLYPDPHSAVTGINELLVNAIEHGNLAIGYEEKTELLGSGEWHKEVHRRLQLPQYAERFVDVHLCNTEQALELTIADCGDGFDPRPFLEIDPERFAETHGRGVALARLISFDSVAFLGKGNVVRTVVKRREQ